MIGDCRVGRGARLVKFEARARIGDDGGSRRRLIVKFQIADVDAGDGCLAGRTLTLKLRKLLLVMVALAPLPTTIPEPPNVRVALFVNVKAPASWFSVMPSSGVAALMAISRVVLATNVAVPLGTTGGPRGGR